MNQGSILELEHAIGHSAKINRSVFLHPNGQDYVYIAGGCAVISDLNDKNKQHFLRMHDDQITCLAVSNNGQFIATGQKGNNSDVIIWDFNSKQAKYKLSEHDYEVSFISFSHDDKLLFSAGNSMDKKIYIWDTSNGYIVAKHVLAPDPLSCMRWGGFVKDIKGRNTDRYQLATAGNKQIMLWKLDTKTGYFETEIVNLGMVVREYICLDFSKNNEDCLFAGSSSGDFICINIKSKSISAIIQVANSGISSIQSISNDSLIVGCGNGTLANYQIDNNKFLIKKKIQLNGIINSLDSFKQNSICATDKGFIFLIQNSTLNMQLLGENHTNAITYLTYPKGISDKFASCSEDGTIRLWNINDYQVESRCVAQGAGSPNCCSYNEEVLISGWQDGKIRMYLTQTSQLLWTIDNAHKGGVCDIILSNNLKFLATGGKEGEVRIWHMKSREMYCNLKEHTQKVTKIQFLDNDTKLISSSRDRALLQWDLKTEKRIFAQIQRMGAINSFDIVNDTALTTGQDRKITYWNLKQQNPINQLDTSKDPKNSDELYSLVVSHDGTIFATGGSEQIVKIWDIKTGQLICEQFGHSSCIKTLQFSYDDKQLISGGLDGNIMIWNVYKN